MLQSDPLSLVFLGCALFSGLFLAVSVLLGAGHGHVGHVGHVGHTGHIGHVGHIAHGSPSTHAAAGQTHAAPAGHGHASQSAAHSRASGETNAASGAEGLWAGVQSLLLGAVNINGALIFLLVFGVLGYLLNSGGGANTALVIIVAALVGALAAIAVNAALVRIFVRTQAGELGSESSRLEGRLATVSVAIRAGGLGEIIYTGVAGARQSLGARSADDAAVAVGTEVVVTAVERGVATVQPWESLLAETRQRLSAPAPDQS